MSQLTKIKGPDAVGREAMYYADKQDFAYQRGSYDYLDSIAFVPKMASLAGYIKALGVQKVLDIGCGTGPLLPYLDSSTAYVGVDIAPTAIEQAREKYAQRPSTAFFTADLRTWKPPSCDFDCVVWAGVGQAWTKGGRRGSSSDWLDIIRFGESCLIPGGYLMIELVTSHWPALQGLIGERYHYTAGCDLDCFQTEESPKRSIRIFQVKQPVPQLPETSTGPLVSRQTANRIIDLGKKMGQHTSAEQANLGFGFLYYSFVRLYQPETVVCIGSYRGFAPVCLALGLADNGKGTCFFIDPGLVDRHWHQPQNVVQLRRTFGLGDRLAHIHMTSRQAAEAGAVPEQIDLLLIDGEHSYEGVKYDFDVYAKRVQKDGLILLHDSSVTGKGFSRWEVKPFIQAEIVGNKQYELLNLPFSSGLAVVRKLA
jgi:SAM-dependent methyltransferase